MSTKALRSVLVVCAAGMALAVAVAGAAGAKNEDRRLAESPPGQVMVIDANLLEVFQAADVADPQDMENFVRILLPRLQYAPDALALQDADHNFQWALLGMETAGRDAPSTEGAPR